MLSAQNDWTHWFLLQAVPPSQQIAGWHDPWLVALSIGVAVAAS